MFAATIHDLEFSPIVFNPGVLPFPKITLRLEASGPRSENGLTSRRLDHLSGIGVKVTVRVIIKQAR
jgi:hypothetical protein